MKYGYETYQMNVEEHLFWVAKSNMLKGCVGQGDTIEEAVSELSVNESAWIETAKECGISVPDSVPVSEVSYSGKLSLRISSFVHEEVANFSKTEGISINQYINDAIAYYNGIHRARVSLENILPEQKSMSFEAPLPRVHQTDNVISFHMNKEEM